MVWLKEFNARCIWYGLKNLMLDAYGIERVNRLKDKQLKERLVNWKLKPLTPNPMEDLSSSIWGQNVTQGQFNVKCPARFIG